MSFIDEFTDVMPTTLTLERVASSTIAGKPTYSVAVSYTCHVQMRAIGIRRTDGTVDTGRGVIYIKGVVSLTPKDRITIAALAPGVTAPPILDVGGSFDELGEAFTSVVFG
jgi:hypothetical protein